MAPNYISRKDAAAFLLISEDSLLNWEKQNTLKSFNNTYNEKDIFKIKSEIKKGKIKRLTKRANKTLSTKKFISKEIFSSKDDIKLINLIIQRSINSDLPIHEIIFITSLAALVNTEEIFTTDYSQITSFEEKYFKRKNSRRILQDYFFNNITNTNNKQIIFFYDILKISNCKIIGPLYQSLLAEGKKSKTGTYYTPESIIAQIIGDYIQPNCKVLDPCCGTGQFLQIFAKHILNPEQIYGFDIDKIAVFIAKILLIHLYPDKDFMPQIHLGNFLRKQELTQFDYIATNPPWGYRYTTIEKMELASLYPEINSSESYSMFIQQSLKFLKPKGILSILLPESLSNSIVHTNIRKIILRNKILKIRNHGKKFTNVFTEVQSYDIQKMAPEINHNICIANKKQDYKIKQKYLAENKYQIFDFNMNENDRIIKNKIFSQPYITLENKADWALGIVTGNNKSHLQKEALENQEPIFRGSDITAYRLKDPVFYIALHNKKFQQMAPLEKYRAKEKIIYKFISNKLVMAYDNNQRLTLNSANILIPEDPRISIYFILALFNSSLYNFVYQKSFHSLKVIRKYLEILPIPLIKDSLMQEIESLVKKIIANEEKPAAIDRIIYSLFDLTAEEITYIEAQVK